MARARSTQKSTARAQHLLDQQIKQERIQDVRLLLEQMILREEATAKLILDCLYDVGVINLLNQKVRSRTLKWLLRAIARTSKPAFRTYALRRLKRNTPQLITDWLFNQVTFKSDKPVLPTRPVPQTVDTTSIELKQSSQIQHLNQQVVQLRRQVRLWTGVSLGAIAALSGTLLWLLQNPTVRPTPQTSAQSVHWNNQ